MNYAVEMGSVAMIWYKQVHIVHSKSYEDWCRYSKVNEGGGVTQM
jgi:hypothetical protein